jgi:DNA invertase Pin-like site-specific DNA recombinase
MQGHLGGGCRRIEADKTINAPDPKAEFERAMIRERTFAGLAAARAAGRIGGRRKKLEAAKRREIAESVVSGRKSRAEMARLYGVSQLTVTF